MARAARRSGTWQQPGRRVLPGGSGEVPRGRSQSPPGLVRRAVRRSGKIRSRPCATYARCVGYSRLARNHDGQGRSCRCYVPTGLLAGRHGWANRWGPHKSTGGTGLPVRPNAGDWVPGHRGHMAVRTGPCRASGCTGCSVVSRVRAPLTAGVRTFGLYHRLCWSAKWCVCVPLERANRSQPCVRSALPRILQKACCQIVCSIPSTVVE